MEICDGTVTRDNSAVCLIDHQVGLLTGVRDIAISELKHNVVGLAKAARILGISTIGSTTAKDVFWGPTFPEQQVTRTGRKV
jgi:nicotinamidase-related amidase